jgi:hypothetical protein
MPKNQADYPLDEQPFKRQFFMDPSRPTAQQQQLYLEGGTATQPKWQGVREELSLVCPEQRPDGKPCAMHVSNFVAVNSEAPNDAMARKPKYLDRLSDSQVYTNKSLSKMWAKHQKICVSAHRSHMA